MGIFTQLMATALFVPVCRTLAASRCLPTRSTADVTARKQKTYVHALSARSAAHALVTVAVKTVAVFATTFMGTKHPVIVAAVRASGPLRASASQHNQAALSDLVRRCWLGAGW